MFFRLLLCNSTLLDPLDAPGSNRSPKSFTRISVAALCLRFGKHGGCVSELHLVKRPMIAEQKVRLGRPICELCLGLPVECAVEYLIAHDRFDLRQILCAGTRDRGDQLGMWTLMFLHQE